MLSYKYHEWSTGTFDTIKTSSHFLLKKAKFSLVTGLNCTEDGIQGMARAFILAGAQSVLSTLWKVPEKSASVFMQFFYQYLIDGFKSSLALQKAILSVRSFSKYSQYIHWGGYQLTGVDVQFCFKSTTILTTLKNRLGKSSIFPRIAEIKKLEKALVNDPCLPTDVQVHFNQIFACKQSIHISIT